MFVLEKKFVYIYTKKINRQKNNVEKIHENKIHNTAMKINENEKQSKK